MVGLVLRGGQWRAEFEDGVGGLYVGDGSALSGNGLTHLRYCALFGFSVAVGDDCGGVVVRGGVRDKAGGGEG